MGVSFPAITFRAPSQRHRETPANAPTPGAGGAIGGGSRKWKRPKKKNATSSSAVAAVVVERRRRWWSLCRDEDDARPATAASLGDFLEVERRFRDDAFYGAAAELEGVVVDHQPRNGRLLFADGRVLPPAEIDETTSSSSSSGVLCRFPVSLTGICSGGVG